MAAVTPESAANTLRLLADVAVERENDLEQFSSSPDQRSSDEETDSRSPLFDTFYNQGGAAAIVSMANYDPSQFDTLWRNLESFIVRNYNVGRGRRSSHTACDVLFMMMTELKHGGQWDHSARKFGMKGPTFERLIMNFIRMLSDYAYDAFVGSCLAQWSMESMRKKNSSFKHFTRARYATDVTFQQSFQPSGSVQEGKRYFSGKHKLNGFKVEMCVLPPGIAIDCTGHYPGSVSDLEIFKENIRFHKRSLKKTIEEREEVDIGIHSGQWPEHWGIFVDKGY